uniref:Uncharacterized protein n=1 Tax=Anguilla anguilla TaxID=7936 RepID=A0A0E9WXG6_ANGAN
MPKCVPHQAFEINSMCNYKSTAPVQPWQHAAGRANLLPASLFGRCSTVCFDFVQRVVDFGQRLSDA